MEVGTSAEAGAANKADPLASCHPLTLVDVVVGKVGIERGEGIAMVDDDMPAVGVIEGDGADAALLDCADWTAPDIRDIEPGVAVWVMVVSISSPWVL